MNGTFDTTTEPWWATSNVTAGLSDGQLCADVPGGTTNRWDAIIGQNDIALVEGGDVPLLASPRPARPTGTSCGRSSGCRSAPYDTYFEVTPAAERLRQHLLVHVHLARSTPPRAQVAFQLGGSADPWRSAWTTSRCSAASPPEVYEPDTGPRVRVNQVGYLPDGPEERHARHRRDRRRCPGSCKNAAGAVVAQRHDRAARRRRRLRAERPLDRLQPRTRKPGTGLHAGRRRRDQPPVRHRRRPSTSSCGSTR